MSGWLTRPANHGTRGYEKSKFTRGRVCRISRRKLWRRCASDVGILAMTNVRPITMDPYSQRYHALSLAVALPLEYKRVEDVIKVARVLEQYLTGEKK